MYNIVPNNSSTIISNNIVTNNSINIDTNNSSTIISNNIVL